MWKWVPNQLFELVLQARNNSKRATQRSGVLKKRSHSQRRWWSSSPQQQGGDGYSGEMASRQHNETQMHRAPCCSCNLSAVPVTQIYSQTGRRHADGLPSRPPSQSPEHVRQATLVDQLVIRACKLRHSSHRQSLTDLYFCKTYCKSCLLFLYNRLWKYR